MTSFTIKVRLSLFGLLVFGLCFVGCKNTDNEAPETKATDTTAIEDTETVEATPSTPATADFSTVQVVDEARFWEEVCEYDGSRYGFKNRVPAIIDFYADWCRPCAEISPYLVEFAEKYAGQIAIYKVNVDKCPNVAQVFKIQSIPTMVFVKTDHKTQPKMAVGAMSKDDLEKSIKDLLLQ